MVTVKAQQIQNGHVMLMPKRMATQAKRLMSFATRKPVRTRLLVAIALGLGCMQAVSVCAQSYRNSASSSTRSVSVTAEYDGFTIPKFDILVAATEIGRLSEVNVEVGDRVKKGMVVAKLEDGLQREAVATAELRSKMRGELDAAKAEVALAKSRVEQFETLAQQNVARPDELRRAAVDLEVAKARELSMTEQDKLRKLELSRYQLQLLRRRVEAPMDGVVAEVFHAPGEYITPADPAVIRLLVMDQLYAVFNVPVDEIGTMNVGDPVLVAMMSLSKSVRGTIKSIAPGIDGESGTIKVMVVVDNKSGRLRSGDRCRMRLDRSRAASRPTSNPINNDASQNASPSRRLIDGGTIR